MNKNTPAMQFTWYELMATDVARASAFYGELFGWAIHDQQILADGASIGAIFPFPGGAGIGSHWVPYAVVDDLDATVACALAAGGRTCFPPTVHPLGGRFAFLEDAQGAYFSLRSGVVATPTPFVAPKLLADDPPKATAFYDALFGGVPGLIAARPPVAPRTMWLPRVPAFDGERAQRLGGMLVRPHVVVDPTGGVIAMPEATDAA